jgi:elongator complex protein 3
MKATQAKQLSQHAYNSHPLHTLEDTVYAILALPTTSRTPDEMIKYKRKYAKENKLSDVPTNMQLFQAYRIMVASWKISTTERFETLLKKRSIRSASGIVPIQVLTKPFWCPWKCIFCPNDASMPKSYINTQPWAMRALLNEFDPYKQVYNRLLSLTLTGHNTDKIEMIVLWWTRDVYPEKYKTWFIKWLYDACNTFPEFLKTIDIDCASGKAARYTATEELGINYDPTITGSLLRNETAQQRIIWLTIETRPEYVTHKNCQYWRSLWVTRMEMGIQSLDDHVLKANKRWHGTKEIFAAMHMLRQYGFKISTHLMPWLYMSTYEKDKETFDIAYSSPHIKPDEIKFYPTAVIPNTELYDLYKQWQYIPLDDDKLKRLIYEIKTEIIPPYTRIKRLARDFDTNEVVAWANTPNLRQLVMDAMVKELNTDISLREKIYSRLWYGLTYQDSLQEMLDKLAIPMQKSTQERKTSWGLSYVYDESIESFTVASSMDTVSIRWFVCLCTRCREVRNKEITEKNNESSLMLLVRRYRSSVWEELFISIEDQQWYLSWFTRLLLPDSEHALTWEWLGSSTALIRELHVYWALTKINVVLDEATQHKWLWTQMMRFAEKITQTRWYNRLSVISWVWVRWYYEHLWYKKEWTYMVRELSSIQ